MVNKQERFFVLECKFVRNDHAHNFHRVHAHDLQQQTLQLGHQTPEPPLCQELHLLIADLKWKGPEVLPSVFC